MNILTDKRCSKCGEWKDKGEFHKDNSKKSGYSSYCKWCSGEHGRKYRADHLEEGRERSRKYAKQNASTILQRVLKWATENRNKTREYKRRWRINHPEEKRESDRNYRANNAAKLNEYSRQYRVAYPEKGIEISRKWAKANPDKRRVNETNRRARKLGNGGTFTMQEWQALKEFYNFICLRCGRKEPEILLTPDHVLPLVRGGSNSIDNIQPLCRSCNCSKHTKHIDYRRGG